MQDAEVGAGSASEDASATEEMQAGGESAALQTSGEGPDPGGLPSVLFAGKGNP
jgi:hypothetical protein